MQILWSDLITRARVYVDDDHAQETHWIEDPRWMTIFQVEYALLYKKWLRNGYITAPPVEQTFAATSVLIANPVLAIVGVAEDLVSYKRLLEPAQARFGRAPFWEGTNATGRAVYWEATGLSDTMTIKVHPPTAASFVVRYYQAPVYVTDPTTTVDLPYGSDERLVLGAVRRANVKASSRSAAVDALIVEADAEIEMMAAGRNGSDGFRVRRSPSRTARGAFAGRFGDVFPPSPAYWYWF